MPEDHVTYAAEPEPAAADDIERDLLVDRVVASYDTLMHHVATAHVAEFVGVGVTMSQAKVLYLVQAEPDIRMSDLAGRMAVTLPSMSGVVDRLVDQGLLTRRDDPSDRRQALVRISDAGVQQLEAFRELNARQVRNLLHRLATADLVVVARAIDVLAAAAAAATRDAGAASSIPVTASPSTTTGGSPS